MRRSDLPLNQGGGKKFSSDKSSILIDFKVLPGVYNQLNCW